MNGSLTQPAIASQKKSSSAGRFKTWEWALLALSLGVTTGAALIYTSGYPIRNWIFGLDDTELDREIGKVSQAQGSIRRQLRKNPEFKALPVDDVLYNRDTVVTGPNAGATLEISDVGTIELGPNTMVRLVFAEQGAIGAINRATVVDVIQGSVTGKASAAPILLRSKAGITEIAKNTDQKVVAAKPKPTPKTARVALPPLPILAAPPAPPAVAPVTPVAVAPVPQATPFKISQTPAANLEVAESASQPAVPVQLAWSGGPSDSQVQLEIIKKGAREPLIAQTLPSKGGELNTWRSELKQAGQFTWRLKDAEGNTIRTEGDALAEGQMVVRPDWKKLAPLKALVGGQEKDNNDFEGGSLKRSPAITLRWKSLVPQDLISPGSQALLKVWDAADPSQVLYEGRVSGNEFEFSKDRLYLGKINWTVSIPARGGFLLTSGIQEFQVKFNPPTQVEPTVDAQFSRAKLGKTSDGSILLTWKKTLFTDSYEVEVASDAQFKQVIWKLKPKENYALFKASKDQAFWWRVRSTNGTGASAFNSGRKFSVGP